MMDTPSIACPVWLMVVFGVVGYVFKKIGIPLAPFTLALVLGNRRDEDAIPALTRALDDVHPTVREAAAWALRRIAE